MKKSTGIICSVILIISMIITVIFPSGSVLRAEAASKEMEDISAGETVSRMGIGWNLGNTFDSHGSYGGSNYQMIGFYMDGTDYAWTMSPAIPFNNEKDGKADTATLTWQMASVKSSDNSRTSTLGFQIWNFSDHIPAGTELEVDVLKAEIKTGGKIYTFPELLGSHTVVMDGGGVASFQTDKFNSLLSKSSQVKEGTLTLSIRLFPYKSVTKQEYFETLWGNPLTTKALINKVKEAGFNAVRVPVTWFTNMDGGGNIDEAWISRVEEVVNYVLDNDMYCIINLHHDTAFVTDYGAGWLVADTSDPSVEKCFASLWKQIAERFKDYDEHLLFEGFNEILTQDANGNEIWGYPGSNAIAAVNTLNQLFVDTVRATGGNNAKRSLVVNTYAASTAQGIIDGFILPTDTVKDHLIVEVHEYTPMEFGYYNVTWTPMRNTWGTQADKAALDAIFDRLEKRFISNKIPVIIGEFGTCNKNNTAERTEHAGYYIAAAKKRGIVCFWWDNGGRFDVGSGETYKESGLINRSTLQWVYPEIVKTMMEAAYSPDKVSNISAASNKSGTITVKWDKCTGASGYQVVYSSSKTGGYKSAGTTGSQTYTIGKLITGKTYYFKVRAYLKINGKTYYGAYSSIKSIKVK